MRDGKTARRQDGEKGGRGDAGAARVPGIRIAGVSTSGYLDDPELVEIRPAPSPSERAAILTALELMLGGSRRDEAPRPSAWSHAGRRESIQRGDAGSRTGWGRAGDWPEG